MFTRRNGQHTGRRNGAGNGAADLRIATFRDGDRMHGMPNHDAYLDPKEDLPRSRRTAHLPASVVPRPEDLGFDGPRVAEVLKEPWQAVPSSRPAVGRAPVVRPRHLAPAAFEMPALPPVSRGASVADYTLAAHALNSGRPVAYPPIVQPHLPNRG